VGCSDAPGKQLGVQCLAQGHFDLLLMGRAWIEPATLGLQDDPLTPLSYSRPRIAKRDAVSARGLEGRPEGFGPLGATVSFGNQALSWDVDYICAHAQTLSVT